MPPLPESAREARTLTAACPSCGDPLDAEDRFCGGCGHDLAAAAPQPAAAPDTTADTTAGAVEGAGAGAGAEAGGQGDAGHTDSFRLAPPRTGDADTLVLSGLAGPADPREELLDGPREQPAADHGASPDANPEANPDPAPAAQSGEAAADGPVCVACGLGGVDDDGYCEHCGHAQPRQRDHQEKELEAVAAVSDRGLRHHRNEDAFVIATASLPDGGRAVSAVVCDGVSTAYRPDDASAAASAAGSEALLGALERGAPAEEAMRTALLAAFDAVVALADEEEPDAPAHHNSPACTCVSAVVTGPVFTVGWIGDSRAYWIPDDRGLPSSRLTEDDSWAARMVSAGLMTEAEAYADERAHAITGWLGADAVEVDPHVAAFQPEGPGVIVVCTDGLWNYAESAAEMAEAVPPDARTRPLHSARALLGLALDGGGHDNVTVAVLPFPATASRAGFPPAG
jgi:serine/threonine protein phosphatase PrpC